MAAVKGRLSNHSLYNFFDTERSSSCSKNPENIDKDTERTIDSRSPTGFRIKEISISPLSQNDVDDANDIMCISIAPKKSSEHEIDNSSDKPSRLSSTSGSRCPSVTSSDSNYSEDFSSCASTPKNEVTNTFLKDDDKNDTERSKSNDIVENVGIKDSIEPPRCKSRSDFAQSPYSYSQTPKSKSRQTVKKLTKSKSPTQEIERCSQNTTETKCRQNLKCQSNSDDGGVKLQSLHEEECNSFADIVSTEMKDRTKIELYQQGKVTQHETKHTEIEDTKPNPRNSHSLSKKNVTISEDSGNNSKTNKKRFVVRQPLSKQGDEKKIHTKKYLINKAKNPSFNNNSKQKPKQCKSNFGSWDRSSAETSGRDSVGEAVINILKVNNSSHNYSDFENHFDEYFMANSTSGHSFASRYTANSFETSPYNSSSYSSSPKRCYQPKGQLSLPSIDKTVPGQLVRGGTHNVKGNSDSDISTGALANRRKQLRKPANTVGAKDCIATKKIGDFTKPKVPIQLKAEAMLRDGQLEVFVTDKENVAIGINCLNVKITVVHKYIEPKPRFVPKRQPEIQTKRKLLISNREVIKQRAMLPPFNTHTDTQASDRHYKCFGY
ncbi:unnamed protein product [Mytilus coruscus]|uniref:Uncharacterized protein n=1 Tax=Mytilus coruscus TaxID=42192 RepID=A0A6J8DHF3_MYTCO|nr:unnamed protein product [Mytilus coruscus]